jgi:hypothetical protein
MVTRPKFPEKKNPEKKLREAQHRRARTKAEWNRNIPDTKDSCAREEFADEIREAAEELLEHGQYVHANNGLSIRR